MDTGQSLRATRTGATRRIGATDRRSFRFVLVEGRGLLMADFVAKLFGDSNEQ